MYLFGILIVSVADASPNLRTGTAVTRHIHRMHVPSFYRTPVQRASGNQTWPAVINQTASTTNWVELGPFSVWNIKDGRGSTGTVADAASPPGHPEIIYLGGQNNAAASGVMKTTDGGKTWQSVNNGVTDTRIWSVIVDPSDGNHVMVGTPSGVFESSDAGGSWALRSETSSWAGPRQFLVATIAGKQHIIGSAQEGIIYRPVGSHDTWSIFSKPDGLNAIDWLSDCGVDSSSGDTICYVQQVANTISNPKP